jgi:ATP-dependent DNA helicase DinG
MPRAGAMIAQVAEALGSEGSLAHHVPGFAPRASQLTMAAAVARTLEENATLIVEAGTGTGKTYAYLVPALLSGRKVIISTGTRNLQDQLFRKDLPVVLRALGVPVRIAMLKGRGNYLCLHRFALLEQSGRLGSRGQAAELGRIREWVGRTRTGDVAEVEGVPESSAIWPRVTSTVDNCLGQQCPHLPDCHVINARRQAQEADLLVINHHLFFADMAIKQEAFGELLPGADALIMDEAHQLSELAGQFFGLSLSSRQLLDLARDTLAEHLRDAADFVVLRERSQCLEHRVEELRLALGPGLRRGFWREVAELPELTAALASLIGALRELGGALREAAPRGKGLESCWKRCGDVLERLGSLTEVTGEDSVQDNVHWFETRSRGFTLNLTPLDVAATFNGCMARYQSAWVFTSATLAVGDSFAHFASQLGLRETQSLRLESPFDFARNGLLYHPQGLPDPSTPAYGQALVEAVLPVLEASRGRAFVLFTSHHALQEAASALDGKLDYPLLVQGSLSKAELLERFRRFGNAVLLGTASFWEGVDVRGEALSCVVIAKLPFASPGDPVLQARIDAMRRRGGDPFRSYQLPHAVIALKQGVGRLIRDIHDRGVLVLCDPRLLSRSYGRVFLASLPPMIRTRKLERVQRFFAQGRSRDPAQS